MEHDAYKMILPLHALSSLDGDEASSLEQHLASCGECRSELDAWEASAGALAYVAEPIEPSPEVRTRILETVRQEPRPQRSETVLPFARPAAVVKPTSSWMLPIAAVIIVALGLGLMLTWQLYRSAQTNLARVKEELESTSAKLEREISALQVLTAPGARMAELAGTKEAPTAHAMVAIDDKTRRAVFMAQGLPQAPAGKAYQLWFIAGGKPMPSNVFTTDSAGNAMMMDDQVTSEALKAGAFAVTLEPQNGVQAPTGPMVLMMPTKPA
jgi:anti-sigma-K factor RskA